MKLKFLLDDAAQTMPYKAKKLDLSADASGVTDDTSKFMPGMIFVCIKGEKFDGHDFAAKMLDHGAVCVVTEKDLGLGPKQAIVSDSRVFYGLLCASWFGHPEKKLKLIGVTGTNGKTTITTMISFMLRKCRKKVGLIGTGGVFIDEKELPRDDSTPTTPKAYELYEIFSKMAAAKCDYVVMEVTSFALEQNRIGPAKFSIGVFTNLTRDHLDYHKTMDNYYEAKKKLFMNGNCAVAIVNTADYYGAKLYSELTCEKYSYGVGKGHSIYADNVTSSGVGMRFWIYTFGKSPEGCPVTLNMVGSYNVQNAVAATAVCMRLGMLLKDAAASLAVFNGVRGRCEIIPTKRSFTVVCDYAHSPDALEKLLAAIKPNTKGKLICLFGCGGDRDKTKRPLMAAAVEKYANRIIVTSDNPRNEDPDAIIDDIAAGFLPSTVYDRITDRAEAILHGIKTAKEGDVLVLAGKGHEDYQILADNKHIHFDEREVVAAALKKVYGDSGVSDKSKRKREILSLDDVCRAMRGKAFGASYNPNTKIFADEISSDTRTIKEGALFFGLKGENFNGSSFAEMACTTKGAVCAVTDRVIKNTPCITVPDTTRALLDLSGYFRNKFDPILVGVTGSVGKTTSKDLIACALSSKYKTLKTAGNRNNHVGMPFTLLKLTSEIEAAVVEMGMNHAGEITRLAKAARPTICVITNIGYSHIENFSSRDGILNAKLEILNGAKGDAPLIVNGDDDLLYKLKGRINRRVITCGVKNSDCDFTAANIKITEEQTEFDIYKNGVSSGHCVIPAVGSHYVTDGLIAAAVSDCAGCLISDAAAAMKKYSPSGLRQHIEIMKDQKVIVDCYNAAPVSVKAAIDVLKTISVAKGGRRVCVLADMLELGNHSAELHREIGEYAVRNGTDIVIAYGKFSENIAEGAKKAGGTAYCTDKFPVLMDYLRSYLKSGDAVLFKGSRAMKLEEAIDGYYKKHDNKHN